MRKVNFLNSTPKEEYRSFGTGYFDVLIELDGIRYVCGIDGYGYMYIRREDGMFLTTSGFKAPTIDEETGYLEEPEDCAFSFKVDENSNGTNDFIISLIDSVNK